MNFDNLKIYENDNGDLSSEGLLVDKKLS